MRVAVLHYHLRAGGVTRVIEMAAQALAGQGVEVLVVAGEPAPPGTRLMSLAVVPELAYGAGAHEADGLAAGVDRACRARWGAPADVLHIHNHCLGKNLSLPVAVSRWALEGRAMVLQMHDFAENGRPLNYRFLRRGLGGFDGLSRTLYPLGARIAHAVLGSGAAGLLARGGGTASVVPNPVVLPTDATPAGAAEFSADRLLVYPTRGIRRKNLGEALLHAASAGAGTRLVITSAPAPGPESAPYARWRTFAESLALPVVFDAAGATGRSVYDFLFGADLCLTTSIEEGFGMAFLEPWAAGRGLAGRDLPEVTADAKAEGLNLGNLYTSLDVPLTPRQARAAAEFHARRHTAGAAAYGLAPPRDSGAPVNPERIVDFGALPPAIQRAVIARKHVLPPLERPAQSVIEANRAIVSARHAPQHYAGKLLGLYRSTAAAPRETPRFLDAGRVLGAFLGQ
jgi:glycosyltransferase involved in cell wall biosynthesis